MKRKYWITLGVVVVALAVGAWLLFGKKKETAAEFRTATVEKGDVKIAVTATGTLSADTTVQVGTQVSGIISKIFVDFNSVVKKGQVVALLDTTYLAAAVEDAASALYRNQVQLDLTKRNFDRTKELFTEKVVAQADYDQAISDYETAKANVRSAKSALERSKINLRYATIVAPVSGVVISRNVDRGQTVASSFNTPTLFTIANDLTKMQVQASVDEADIGKIKVGQDVDFTVDAYTDRSFRGTVRQVRLQPTVVQNVVNYTVIIDVPNPDLALMPGMTANITVKIQEVQDVMKVPASALKFFPPDDYLAAALKDMPDSTRKMIEKIMKFREMRGKGGAGNRQMSSQGEKSGRANAPAAGQPTGTGAVKENPSSQSRGSMVDRSGFGNKTGRSGYAGKRDHAGRKSGVNEVPVAVQVQPYEPPVETFRPAIIWLKQGTRLMPYHVKAGLTDGSYTHIEGNIPENSEVVTGTVSNSAQNGQQQQNPFAPQRMTGRGGR